MRFYTGQHEHYCGIDLHARSMYVCILDQAGEIVLHRNIPADAERFLRLVAPYREGLVVGVECIFTWYWLADLCAAEEIPFVLGHALYMKAIHSGKGKNDRVDSHKIAILLRGGTIRRLSLDRYLVQRHVAVAVPETKSGPSAQDWISRK